MVNGGIKCLGSTQHLKSRFGHGYTLLAKVAITIEGGIPDLQPLKNFIMAEFPGEIKILIGFVLVFRPPCGQDFVGNRSVGVGLAVCHGTSVGLLSNRIVVKVINT